jgi:hypothetical protein
MEGRQGSAAAHCGAARASHDPDRPRGHRARLRLPVRADLPHLLTAPTVTGDPRIGGTLTCERGLWNDGPREPYEYEFQWTRRTGWNTYERIEGATAATYTVTREDAGSELSGSNKVLPVRGPRPDLWSPRGPGHHGRYGAKAWKMIAQSAIDNAVGYGVGFGWNTAINGML